MDFIASPDEIVQPAGDFVASPDEIISPQTPGESFARGALRNFPFAQQIAAAAAPINPLSAERTYSKELQHLDEAAEAGKAENKKAYMTGAVTGAVAPAFVAPESLAANPAIFGALSGAGQATSDISATQNPKQFAKEAAMGAGTGAIVGKLAPWLGKLVPTPAESQAEATLRSVKVPARAMTNLLGKNVEEGAGELENALSPLREASDTPMRISNKVSEAVDEYGKQIGDITKDIKFDVATDQLKKDIDKLATSNNGLTVRNAGLDKIKQIINDNAKGGNLTFGKLRDLSREVYEEMIQVDPQTHNLLPGSKQPMAAWKYLRSLQDAIVQKTKPQEFGAFQEANQNYHTLIGLRKGMNTAAVREAMKVPQNMGANLNPLTLATNLGKGAVNSLGLDRLYRNTAPSVVKNIVNPLRNIAPENIPTNAYADLATYLESRFGKKNEP